MAISYVGGQTAGRAGNTGTTVVNFSFTGGTNATPSANDLVVVTIVVGSQNRTPTLNIATPTGYTNLTQQNSNGTTYDTSMVVAYKRMGTTPDTSVTIPATGNADDAQRWTIQCFRGVDTTTPMDATAVPATGTGTGRPNPAAITPVTTGAWVTIHGGGSAATGAAYTAPANFTTNFLTGTTADINDAMVGSGYWTGWTSGQVDPAAYTGGTTNAADSWAAYTLALRPAPAAQTLTQASRFDNAQTFYTHTLTPGAVTLNQGTRFDNSQTIYAATVTQSGGAQSLLPNLYTNDQVFYGPTVTRGAVTLTPNLYSNAQTFFAPTVGRGAVNLSPARYDNGQAFYSATLTTSQVLAPARYDNANTFYTPIVSQAGGAQFLAPDLFTNTNQFFGGLFTLYITFPDWVEPGWVEPGWVEWPYFNQNQFFSATVTQGDAPAQDDQRGDGVDARWTKKQRKQRDREIEQERKDREKLREVIEQIIDPKAPEPVEVVQTARQVKVVQAADTIVLPKFPTIDLAEVTRQVTQAVQAAQEARRAQARAAEQAAMEAEAQRIAEENLRRRIKRRREEELLLLL